MNSDSSYRKYPTAKFLATYNNKSGETLMDSLATDADPVKKLEPVKFVTSKKNEKTRRIQNGYVGENIPNKISPHKLSAKAQKTVNLKRQLSSFSNNFSS